MVNRSWRAVFLFLVPLLVMLPRLLSPQFGFFDDPGILSQADSIVSGEWSLKLDASLGRFRPIYWYYHAALYGLFGENPFGFFIGNTVLLIFLVFLLYSTLKRFGGREVQVWTALITLLISGPLLESSYTLSKPELLQSFFFAIFLWVSSFSYLQLSTRRRLSLYFIGGVAALLACLTKETAVLLLPIGIAATILMSLAERVSFVGKSWKIWGVQFFISSAIGVLAYMLLRRLYLPAGLIAQGYASGFTFEGEYLLQNTRILLDIVSRDYLYLLPLGLIFILSLDKSKKKGVVMLVIAAGWSLAWFAAYVPWRFTQLYYLLPFSMGASIVAGIAIPELSSLIRPQTRWKGRIGWIAVVLGVLLFIASAMNQIASVRMQLAVDASNEEMLQYVIDEVKPRSLVLLNIQQPNEYVGQFSLAVRSLGGREDLQIEYVRLHELPAADKQPVYYILPVLENQFYPSFRMGIFEHTSRAWNRDLLKELREPGDPDVEIRNGFGSFVIDPLRSFCPLTPRFPYCQVPNTPLDTRAVRYGWDIYIMERDSPQGS